MTTAQTNPGLSSISLAPQVVGQAIPFGDILQAWVGVQFEPSEVRPVLEEMLHQRKVSADLFDFAQFEAGGMLLRPPALFPSPKDWVFLADSSDELEDTYGEIVRSTRLKVISALLRNDAGTRNSLRSEFSEMSSGLWRALTDIVVDKTAMPQYERVPGIYRLEHASLLVQSATTRILIDPVGLHESNNLHSSYGKLASLDAILISHGHGDHWHPPSIFRRAATSSLPIVVPDVPRANVLSPDVFARTLKGCAQRCVVGKWGESIPFGDIVVDILPFYGEQPVKSAPKLRKGIRNWGNCFRINAPQFSVLVLVDSGTDPDGSMLDVVTRSTDEKGPIDLALSCMRSFPAPFYGGLLPYWSGVPFKRLRSLYFDWQAGNLEPVTAGVVDIASIINSTKIRHFLPYAHGFDAFGKRIEDIGWGTGEPTERAALQDLQKLTHAECVEWNPGDFAEIRDGKIKIHEYSPF